MKRLLRLLAVLALVTAACGGGGDDGGDDEADAPPADETTTTTTAGDDLDAVFEEGEDVFADYIEALLAGNYDTALEHSTGAAAAVAGYFNTLTRIPSLPTDFQVPKRQVKLSFTGNAATRGADGTFTLDSTVDADITGGGADEKTTYQQIKLEREGDKLVVVDFARGRDGPVSEDVYRTEGAKGSGDGIAVQMGPGFGMRGAIGAGGRNFSNFVFAYENQTDYTAQLHETNNNKLNFAASLDTGDGRYVSSSSAGTEAAPGARGFGFVYFNAEVEGSQGVLTLRFFDEDDDEYEVKVPLERL